MVTRPAAPDTVGFLPSCSPHRRLRRGLAVAALLLAAAGAGAAPSDTARPTITNPDVVWAMTTAERDLEYPVFLEGRVNFADPGWGNCWLESGGVAYYLPLARSAPPPLRSGQRVRITGQFVPAHGLAAGVATVTVLEDFAPVVPVPTAGRLSELRTFDRRVVETEAYVDEQLFIDDRHLRLHLIVENRAVIGWVVPDDQFRLPDWTGRYVRLRAVYSGRIDPTGTSSTIELWAPRESDVTVLGSIATAPEFDRPRTPIAQLGESPRGTVVKLRGRVQSRDIGQRLVLRDETGEVLVETLQRERLPADAEVEVVGRTQVAGARWILADALFRRGAAPADAAPAPPSAPGETLRTVGAVRQLGREAAAAGAKVDVAGLVVWSLPEADFFYLQDLSGGVRVQLPPGRPAPALQKSMRVEGRTAAGDGGPFVRMEVGHDLGSMAHPQARAVTVTQARSGSEDGQWVALRGFIQRTVSEGDWRWVHVTCPDGEFVGHLQSPVNFVATPGSLIRVQGVCEPAGGAARTGTVVLRVPFLHDLTIEEDAPADPFALPLRAVADLRQVAALRELTRVRVAGVVLRRGPGREVVIQDAVTAVKLSLAEGVAAAAPGETIEAVGILGREGARTVLRETLLRPTAARPAPPPLHLAGPHEAHAGIDQRLVRVRAELVDRLDWPDRTRLTLRTHDTFFDAVLPRGPGGGDLRAGALLELTGLCFVEYDDTLQPRGMSLALRTPADAVVLAPARFWTVTRLWLLVGGVVACTAWVAVWLAVLRSRVRRQTAEIERQLARQAKLEAELERTQRMQSLGSLAGGIAHDFNNLLTGVLGNVTFVLNDGEVHGVHAEALREVAAGARRAKELTAQMITFAQGGAPAAASLDLATLLAGSVGLAFSGAATRADLQPAADLWPVLADRGQLARALQSLLAHARSQVAPGGTVPVLAVNDPVRDGGPLRPGRYVRVTVEVPGFVVPAERIGGYFDPYVSTRYGDESFALAIAYSIAKRHGGDLEVRSHAALGTVFRLWLPAADVPPAPEPAESERTTRTAPPPELFGVRVLVMDDEPIIRRLTERFLRVLKCDVATAADGAECVKLYGEALAAGRPFRVVILDLTVPGGMGGHEALEALRALDPAVRAIVSSGYFNDPVMARYAEHGFRAAVAKPYGSDVLAEAVRRVATE